METHSTQLANIPGMMVSIPRGPDERVVTLHFIGELDISDMNAEGGCLAVRDGYNNEYGPRIAIERGDFSIDMDALIPPCPPHGSGDFTYQLAWALRAAPGAIRLISGSASFTEKEL